MNLIKELQENQVILLLIPSDKYNEISLNFAKNLSTKSICYVTLNKTYSSIMDNLANKGIDISNINFIDAISKQLQINLKNQKIVII